MPDTTNQSGYDPEQRVEDRLHQLGTRTPACSNPGCAETNPFALSGVHPDILCAEHRADRDGRSWLEGSHTGGHHNLPIDVVVSPANDHACISEMQREWPRETLRNPYGSPLLRAAAAIRGWLDVLRVIIDRTVGWVPDILERLDASLTKSQGPQWWHHLLPEGEES